MLWIAYNIFNFPHFQIHPPGAVFTALSMLLFYHIYAVLYSGECFSFAESGIIPQLSAECKRN